MSYEGKMLEELRMPTRQEVEHALLRTLFEHNGVIKEFGSGEEIVHELANEFALDQNQRRAILETVYRKENRVKTSLLWHRLLFRAADSLAKEKLVSRPTSTFQLTNKREWMLTEAGFDRALKLLNIPADQKSSLPTKSFEVQKIVKKLTETPRPERYDPFDKKTAVTIVREGTLRARGFRRAVIEAYDFKCAFCGLKLKSPDSLCWEVEAAHIVPHSCDGKDDIWNGIALCRFHHWAFDVGWFSIRDDLTINVSNKIDALPSNIGRTKDYDLVRMFSGGNDKIYLPEEQNLYPHINAISWHRANRFYR